MNKSRIWYPTSKEIRIHPLSEFHFAVFNGAYWDSSVLNAIDASLLAFICEAGLSGLPDVEAFRKTAAKLELQRDENYTRYGENALEQLAEVGLICEEICIENQ